MQIIRKTAEGTKFEFVCEYDSNRYGFNHTATLFRNGVEISRGRQHWINRTWESWTYQSACQRAVYTLLDGIKADLLDSWKKEKGYARMTAKRREEWAREWERIGSKKLRIKELETLLFSLSSNWPKLYGDNIGERERQIIRNPGNVSRVNAPSGYLCYDINSTDGRDRCTYNVKSKSFIG